MERRTCISNKSKLINEHEIKQKFHICYMHMTYHHSRLLEGNIRRKGLLISDKVGPIVLIYLVLLIHKINLKEEIQRLLSSSTHWRVTSLVILLIQRFLISCIFHAHTCMIGMNRKDLNSRLRSKSHGFKPLSFSVNKWYVNLKNLHKNKWIS